MIIKLKKYLILGAKEDLDPFFARAQQKGIVEFISPHGRRSHEFTPEIQHLLDALKIVRKLPPKTSHLGRVDLQEAEEIALRVSDLKMEVERLYEEKRLLQTEIVRVAPFGDFSLDDIDIIERDAKRHIQFFCMKTARSHQTNFTEEVLYIGTEFDLDYFMTINPKPKTYPDMIEMRIDRPLGELKTHLAFVNESLHQIEAELKGYAGHLDYLHEALVTRLNSFHLDGAKRDVDFPLEKAVFAVEAWVPSNKTNLLYGIIDGMAIHAEPIAVGEEDRVPTYMENKNVRRIGEDLVLIYDVPSPADKDPSGWVFWAFALFFAIIVADGGYGLIYLAICLALKYKFRAVGGMIRRMIRLGICLSTACIVWGVLTASFFGVQLQPDTWIGEISLIQHLASQKAEYHLQKKDDVYDYWVAKYPSSAKATTGQEFLQSVQTVKDGRVSYNMYQNFTDSLLLEFSLLVGTLHIITSFLRYLRRHYAGIGWITFMIGAYFYFPEMLNATSILHFLGVISKEAGPRVGLELMYIGLPMALVFALIQKRLKGLAEISILVQVFGDVLSYLRLYALGLAGSIMAATFNEIGGDIGLFIGALIILFGHAVNMLLGTMSGVIHGLRLNFIEWYHYSFEGGGRLFRPLMILKAKE
ncbi:MAG: V-type ATP synthase subunit I [Verrucomicrobia bacterium]|nr:V-type ATP synthase subunit I [Verrucomicrobiota bacterium]